MTALTELLAKVDARAYERENGGPHRYSDFRNDCESALVPDDALPGLIHGLHDGTAAAILRALVAKEAGDV